MANMKSEVKEMLAALDSTEKYLDQSTSSLGIADRENALRRIYEIRRFYEQENRLLNLLGGYGMEDLIALLERAER